MKIFVYIHIKINDTKCMRKQVLIFGASSGIGFHLAQYFLHAKDSVINCSRRKCPDDRVRSIHCDVSKEGEIEKAFEEIEKCCDGIDYFIYSAGTSMAAPFEYTEEEDYRYLCEVNFLGLAKATQLAIPLVKKKGGKILFISSLGGAVPIPYDPFYSATKSAVNMLAVELNMELKAFGIDVITVLPGGTATDFTAKRLVYPLDKCGSYKAKTAKATKALAQIEQEGMSPQDVAKEIYFGIQGKKIPVYLTIGAKNKLLRGAGKLLPKKALLKSVRRVYDIN